MCMVCQQVLIAKRLERAKNAGKRVVIQSCVCPTPSVPADAFLTKYRVWRHLGRHKHRLRSHGGTNFAETNSPGGQIRGKQYDSHHSYMVPDGSRLETNSSCAQYSGTLCSWRAVQLKGNVLQILSQFWEKLLLAEPPLNPNPRMVWGMCQQECTQHDSRMESFKPSADQHKTEVEAGTRSVKGLDLSKGPKLQPHIISCWRLEDFMRKNFGGRIGLGAVALGS